MTARFARFLGALVFLAPTAALALACVGYGNTTPAAPAGTLAINTAYAVPVPIAGRNWHITGISAFIVRGTAGANWTASVVLMNSTTSAVTQILGTCNGSGQGGGGNAWRSCTLATPVVADLASVANTTLGIQVKTDSAGFLNHNAASSATAVSIAETYSTSMTNLPTATGAPAAMMRIDYQPRLYSLPTLAVPERTMTNVTTVGVGRTAGAVNQSALTAACLSAGTENASGLYFDHTNKMFRRFGP